MFQDSGKGVVRGMSCEGPRQTNEKVNGLVIRHYGDRYFALYAGEDLICVTVYRKGAMEVKRRLEARLGHYAEQVEQSKIDRAEKRMRDLAGKNEGGQK